MHPTDDAHGIHAGGAAGGPTTQREIERKVTVPEDLELPDLATVVPGVAEVRPGAPFTMVAEYHDTPDLRLIRWGVTLRRRVGGPDEGWHMKLPVAGEDPLARDELGLPLSAGEVGEVPAELASLVTALVREAPLVHVATVRTRRTPALLVGEDGRVLAELVDDRVEARTVTEDGGPDADVRRTREIEVESRTAADDDGSADLVDAVAAALVEHGGEHGTRGKAAFALGPRASGAPDVVVPEWPGRGEPAGRTVQAVLADHVRTFLLEDVRVRRDLPDAVHQMRVAARTLRSSLRTFGPLVDAEWSRDLRDRLRDAASALGEARDTEVHLERLTRHADALAPEDRDRVVPVVEAWLRRRSAVARDAVLAELAGPRHLALLIDLVEAARAPRLTDASREPADEVLPALVRGTHTKLRKAVRGLTPQSPAGDWHQVRIRAKRARYAAEAVAPVLGDAAAAWGAAAEQVTDLLGDHHDSAVARVMLRDLAHDSDVDEPRGYALGLLDGVEAAQQRADLEAFAEVWKDARRTVRHHPLG